MIGRTAELLREASASFSLRLVFVAFGRLRLQLVATARGGLEDVTIDQIANDRSQFIGRLPTDPVAQFVSRYPGSIISSVNKGLLCRRQPEPCRIRRGHWGLTAGSFLCLFRGVLRITSDPKFSSATLRRYSYCTPGFANLSENLPQFMKNEAFPIDRITHGPPPFAARHDCDHDGQCTPFQVLGAEQKTSRNRTGR